MRWIAGPFLDVTHSTLRRYLLSLGVAAFLSMSAGAANVVSCTGPVSAHDQDLSVQQSTTPPRPSPLLWNSYGTRYAIIVMGGHENPGQLYIWYWGDTYGMYKELRTHGFLDENIFFLSYGDSATAHSDVVDAWSTTANITAAYGWAEGLCTDEDLLYIFWVDHGSPTYFNTYDGIITHATLGTLMQPIDTKQTIGAYNPCFSGAVIDDISRPGVITVTSQDAYHSNSWGWAGNWRRALRGAPADSIDTNGDGRISMTEAYNWIAPRSQAAGEHSMYDDNGDGIGHEWGRPGYDPETPGDDGYLGNSYTLDGWADATTGVEDPTTGRADGSLRLLPIVPNPFRSATTLRFATPGPDYVRVDVYAADGRKVAGVWQGLKATGVQAITWDGRDGRGRRIAAGIYYVRMSTGGEARVRKLCILR